MADIIDNTKVVGTLQALDGMEEVSREILEVGLKTTSANHYSTHLAPFTTTQFEMRGVWPKILTIYIGYSAPIYWNTLGDPNPKVHVARGTHVFSLARLPRLTQFFVSNYNTQPTPISVYAAGEG